LQQISRLLLINGTVQLINHSRKGSDSKNQYKKRESKLQIAIKHITQPTRQAYCHNQLKGKAAVS